MQYLTEPLFHIGSNYVTAAGLIAFTVFFGAGLSLAKLFQSEPFRRFLTRLKLGKSFASIIPTIPRANTNLTTIAVAERIAGLLARPRQPS